MPKTSIPATAEGMPEIHVEKRIAELASEISQLMDRKRHLGNLTVYPASTGQRANYQAHVQMSQRSVSSMLIDGIDTLAEARAFLDLIDFALDSLSGNTSICTEINALQQGMSEVGKRMSTLKEIVEKAQNAAKDA